MNLDLVLPPPKSIGKVRKIQRKATEVIEGVEQYSYDKKMNLEKTHLREDMK